MIKNGVFIGYLSPGEVRVEFASTLSNVIAYSLTHNIPLAGTFPKVTGPRIASARNKLVEQFLASPGEWLLMVDTDMTMPADVLERFLKVAHKDKAPIVGGLCFGRGGEGLFPTIYRWTGESFTRPEGWDPNTMVACDGTGAACLFVHRSVFERVAEHFDPPFTWFQEGLVLNGTQEIGEDMAFCMRVRSLDIPIFVHTGIPFGHVKEFEIDTKFYKDWCRSHQVIVTGVPSDALRFVSSVLQQVKIPADYERFFNTEFDAIPEWGRADVSWFAAPHLVRHSGAHIVEIVSDDDEPLEKALANHGDWIRQHAPEVTDVASFREAWSKMIEPYVTQRMTVEEITAANILPAANAAGGRLSERHMEQALERLRA
jgi:hypothetical protein